MNRSALRLALLIARTEHNEQRLNGQSFRRYLALSDYSALHQDLSVNQPALEGVGAALTPGSGKLPWRFPESAGRGEHNPFFHCASSADDELKQTTNISWIARSLRRSIEKTK
jgi:hypothetical protein